MQLLGSAPNSGVTEVGLCAEDSACRMAQGTADSKVGDGQTNL